jgi:pyrroline-5-carboxylate reductase
MIKSQRMVFIGGGNMATALIQGLLAAGWSPSALAVADPNPDAQARLSGLGVTATSDAAALFTQVCPELVLLAVKPQVALTVLQNSGLPAGLPLLSIVAGLPLAVLAQALGELPSARPWLRAMPNTPALLRLGMTGLYASQQVSETLRETATAIFQSVGQILWLAEEAQLDAITAVSGSGPAYLFYWLSAWLKGAQALDFSEAEARLLVLQTAEGALALAKAALSQGQTLAQLQAQVASKGGTTEAALAQLDAGAVDAHFIAAIAQALTRAKVLAADSSSYTKG